MIHGFSFSINENALRCTLVEVVEHDFKKQNWSYTILKQIIIFKDLSIFFHRKKLLKLLWPCLKATQPLPGDILLLTVTVSNLKRLRFTKKDVSTCTLTEELKIFKQFFCSHFFCVMRTNSIPLIWEIQAPWFKTVLRICIVEVWGGKKKKF